MALYQVLSAATLPSGELAEWTHWISASSDSEAALYANAYQTVLAASTPWKALFPSSMSFAALHLSQVDEATGTVIGTFNDTVTYVGTGGGSALPPQCSMVVTEYSELSGARYRGRFYLPAMGTAQATTTGRFVTAAVTAALTALAAAFAAGISATSAGEVVVYSRTYRSTTPVLRLSIGDVIDTQRRRRDKLVEVRQSAAI